MHKVRITFQSSHFYATATLDFFADLFSFCLSCWIKESIFTLLPRLRFTLHLLEWNLGELWFCCWWLLSIHRVVNLLANLLSFCCPCDGFGKRFLAKGIILRIIFKCFGGCVCSSCIDDLWNYFCNRRSCIASFMWWKTVEYEYLGTWWI